MIEFGGPIGLFLASFVAATVFPFQSEALLVGLVLAGNNPWAVLLIVASVGNTLGAVVNWGLGRFIHRFAGRPWFPGKGKSFERAERLFQKYGAASLLFAWVPFVGDPLTLIAGVFRVNFGVFLILVAVGKTARYAFLVAAALA